MLLFFVLFLFSSCFILVFLSFLAFVLLKLLSSSLMLPPLLVLVVVMLLLFSLFFPQVIRLARCRHRASYHHAITPTRFFSLSPAGCTHLAALLALLRRHVAGSAVVGRSDFDSRVRCRDFVGHLAARLRATLPHCLSSTCRRNKYEILKSSWG